jgi:uncharacterized protein YcbK (DUF882 family)
LRFLSRISAVLGLAFAAALTCGVSALRADFNTERRIQIFNIHTEESIDIVYKKDGEFIPEALDKLNYFLRDWRKNQVTKMDPHVIDLVWEVHEELGSKVPIHLICGYRTADTNEALRHAGGGQAQHSQHILGKAMDVTFPDIPVQQLRYAGLVREAGGVGYYPTSGVPFVHIDTGTVRMWPRMARNELALLFPSGHSKYTPEDGRPINASDVTYARSHYTQLADAIAAFHQFRASNKDKTLVASADAEQQPAASGEDAVQAEVTATPASASAAAPAATPAVVTLAANQSTDEGAPALAGPALKATIAKAVVAKLTRPVTASADLGIATEQPVKAVVVASTEIPAAGKVAPAFMNKAGWVSQPDYDEEHTDEMSYRPFPLAGLIEANPTTDNPVLSHLSKPDLAAAHQAIGDDEGLKMHFRPNLHVAEMIWNDDQAGRNPDHSLYAETSGQADEGRMVKTASAD